MKQCFKKWITSFKNEVQKVVKKISKDRNDDDDFYDHPFAIF